MLLADGGAKTAAFALQKIHFSNDRFGANRTFGPAPENWKDRVATPTDIALAIRASGFGAPRDGIPFAPDSEKPKFSAC
jgi:hypothetical protein